MECRRSDFCSADRRCPQRLHTQARITPIGSDLPQQPTPREVLDQCTHAKRPARCLIAARDTVVQGAQGGGRDAHYIPGLVGKPLARMVAVVGRCKEGAEEQYKTVRVLVIVVERLFGKVGRIAADLVH